MRALPQPPQQADRQPQQQDDQRECRKRRRQSQQRNQQCTAVEITGLPTPPVKTVDFALSMAVTPCVRPATPPPATMAAVHLTIGGRSVMTAADTTVPATNAAGVAKTS